MVSQFNVHKNHKETFKHKTRLWVLITEILFQAGCEDPALCNSRKWSTHLGTVLMPLFPHLCSRPLRAHLFLVITFPCSVITVTAQSRTLSCQVEVCGAGPYTARSFLQPHAIPGRSNFTSGGTGFTLDHGFPGQAVRSQSSVWPELARATPG